MFLKWKIMVRGTVTDVTLGVFIKLMQESNITLICDYNAFV